MGKVTGFKELARIPAGRRQVQERVHDWREVYQPWPEKDARAQAGRCMDCGVPFCNSGCPLGNLIPEWNDLVYHGNWREAIDRLHATNNFPEFTGRICPAPCEPACTLSINMEAVTIEMIEKAIVERAWKEGWIKPEPPQTRTGKKVAVVGSGPAGMAAAQQLNRAGHRVTLFERSEYIGGLLSLGIPDFKLEKSVVERRVKQMVDEGVETRTRVDVGGPSFPAEKLMSEFDAVCLAVGSTVPRDLEVEGRSLKGVHFAMDYLSQQNRRTKDHEFSPQETITARGKRVVILGGGDTGADCLGTAHRHGAAEVLQFEIMPRPPEARIPVNPWPQWPTAFRTSSAHEEGGLRDYNITTVRLSGNNGAVKRLHCARVDWQPDPHGGMKMVVVQGTEFIVEAELVLLAMGFLHPQHTGLLDDLGVQYDNRGNVKTDAMMMSSVPGVFSCGDAQRGQSLVVHAIASGRMCARGVDLWLMGKSSLPTVRGYARPPLPNGARAQQ